MFSVRDHVLSEQMHITASSKNIYTIVYNYGIVDMVSI